MIAAVELFTNGRRILLALSAPVLLQLKLHRGRGRTIPFHVGRSVRMPDGGGGWGDKRLVGMVIKVRQHVP